MKGKSSNKKVTSGTVRQTAQPVLLSGGNPQVAKADGDAAVQQYIAAMPGWKAATGQQLDKLIVKTVPAVVKAVKWNSPFYGMEGKGWFLSFHCFNKYIKIAFFNGEQLSPKPPEPSKQAATRYLHLFEGDVPDEALLTSWILQASKLPGWLS
ncbi:MAG TPA: DUF1801 domain-containing protein [Chitinophagaceae bacterium]|nr:DUF1801 domain-containing protein [Chitinophagaceae bacterium]